VKRLDVRARVLREVRAFFDARGFLEVQTPVRVPSPGMDLHLDAFPAGDGAWLATSPEYQMKRLLADGWSRIYQIGPALRRGEEGSRHNSEFTMLEWYRGPGTMEDVLADTEQLVARVSGGAFSLGGRTIAARPPFERLSVGEAFERFAGVPRREAIALASDDEDRYFRLLVERVEPALERLDHAVFLVDYPASQASLARRKPSDRTLAERFELYVAGVELCNGFGELTDAAEQRARFEADRAARAARGLPVYPIDEKLLEALTRMPESGGNALGLDRLVALCAGTTDIAEVVAFTAAEL
jgi:lysyl-tRNA synthetase class 2